MSDIADQGDDWLRDFVTDGVEASGENDPEKSAGRTLFELIDGLVYGVRKLHWGSLAPTDLVAGTPWVDTSDPGTGIATFKVYDGASWVDVFTVNTSSHAAALIASIVGKAGTGTSNGSAVGVTGGASGPGATGNGGAASLTGGAAASTNGNGGSVVLTAGAKAGTGVAGVIIERSVKLVKQGAPAAKTVSATLTAAEVLTGIITVNQAAAGASALQLPTAADLDAALPDALAGDALDFCVINTSTVDAEDASLTTNTGWTLAGSMDVPAYSAAGSLNSSGRFRARKTGSAAWTLYRIA